MKIIDNIKKAFRDNPVEITAVAICAIGYVLYVSLCCSVEVLFLASFYGDVQIVEKLFKGRLVFNDLIRRFGEHGMLGYDILLLVNALLFKYSSRFDLVINCINVIICGSFMVYCIQQSVSRKNISYYLGVVLVSMVMFNTMQGSSASMETQVRLGLLFSLLSAYFVSKIITNNATNKTLFAAVALIFIGTNVFGTFYTFAGTPMVLLLMVIYSFKDNKINRNYYVILIAYCVSIILYFKMYNLFGGNNIAGGSILKGVMFWSTHPIELLKSIFAYNASAVIGSAVLIHKVVPNWIYLSVGIFITSIYVYSAILYMRTKMFENTLLPLLLQGYSFFVLILAIIGRYQHADWSWGTSTWYHVHTKMGLAASIWMIIYALSKNYQVTLSLRSLFSQKTVLATGSFLIITSGLCIGIAADIARAQKVRAWYQNIAKYMFVNASEMPIDKNGNTPLFADKSTTMKSLRILKKYELSVFSNLSEAMNIGSELNPKRKLLFGKYYEDGWISREVKAKMNTGDRGYLIGKILLPNDNFVPNGITIFIDGKEVYSQKISSAGDTYFEASCAKNKEVIVKIVMDRSFIPKELGFGADKRELAAIIRDFYFE